MPPLRLLPATCAFIVGGALAFVLYRDAARIPPLFADLNIPMPFRDACPWPDRPPPPVFRNARRCEEIPSALDDFRVELCRSPRACDAFTLRISRTDPVACEAALRSNLQDPSEEEPWAAWMRDERGPDGFFLRVDGVQRLGTEHAVHEGACSYRFDIALQNAGRVYLNAAHYFENYNAYNERNKSWAEVLDRPLFSKLVALDVCASGCPTYSAPKQNSSRDVFTLGDQPDSHHLLDDFLPPCTGDDPIPGVYVPQHPLDALNAPVPYFGVLKRPVYGRYRFVPEGCRFRHAGLRYGDPSVCTRQAAKILVIGDSHGRIAYDAMVHRLSGKTEILLVSEKAHDKNDTVDALDLAFKWDPVLKDATASCAAFVTLLDGIDVFAVSVGAHFQSTSKFITYLTTLLNMIDECDFSSKPPRLIFMTTPAMAPRRDEHPRKFNDKRTSTRQGFLSAVSASLVRAHGWAVIDQFALTEAHTLELMAMDKAHYLATDAIDPIVDELIEKTEVCNVGR